MQTPLIVFSPSLILSLTSVASARNTAFATVELHAWYPLMGGLFVFGFLDLPLLDGDSGVESQVASPLTTYLPPPQLIRTGF